MQWHGWIVLLGLSTWGCGSCGGAQTPAEDAAGATTTAAPEDARFGIVTGVVRLADGAELPSRPSSGGPAQPAPPESCSPPKIADRQPVALGENRGLSGVLVAGADFDAEIPHEPVAHPVVIEDCRLSPPLVVATRGDRIELSSTTDYPFLPTMGPAAFMQALLQGQTRELELDQGGIRSLGCAFAAPCGTTDVVVLYHPVHGITGDGGAFRLENVPPGEELEIHAWHPLFEEASTRVTVEAGATVEVELTLRPAPAQAVAPAGDPSDPAGPSEEPTGPAENQPGPF